ncbi:MAG TPA: TetR/AcrR family transcriptional regulator [Gemmataceae bacterium]|nr:TetR/AcrR family transcriptional regulator [Gemmataceae bacterium]
MDDTDTRSRILDAAQELIQRLGANAISYQHISDAVGIRKASIHHHFPTKEDLIEALIKRYAAYFGGVVESVLAADVPAQEKLRRYCSLFEGTLRLGRHDRACPCAMLGAELATLGSASAGLIRDFYRDNERRLARILEQGRADHSLSFSGSPQATAELIFALLEGGMLVVRANGGAKQFRAITERLIALLGG